MDHVPLAERDRPKPYLKTLVLLVGRMTTIKLAYWAALTAFELALPTFVTGSFAERFPLSLAAVGVATALAMAWAVWSARVDDRHVGGIARSIPTVGTTFVAATAVASPASIPLLLVERQRSIEGCVPVNACHLEAIVLWAAVLAFGMFAIPAAFALALREEAADELRPSP